MSETKTCTMCGKEKTIEDFRKYPGKNDKRYPYCLECQSIETRRRYLVSKRANKTISMEEECELQSIQDLYALRLEKGYKTFGSREHMHTTRHIVDRQMEDLRRL